MAKSPLFSTYRQGENRVTSSMLAVFERIDIGLVSEILASASESTETSLIQFQNQLAGQGSVPDASIKGSFHYLFEVKTERDAVREEQLTGHLRHFDEGTADNVLFVITPDAEPPQIIAGIGDSRIVWISFEALNDAILTELFNDQGLIADRERYLLHELSSLFEADGLLAPHDDVVVVAARTAYPVYLRRSAYICGAGRSFRPGLTRMGFYSAKTIKREFPLILARDMFVTLTEEEASARESGAGEHGEEWARVIRSAITDHPEMAGGEGGIVLLSPSSASETLVLPAEIEHHRAGAWTQGQRYISVGDLEEQPSSTDELDR